MKTARRKDDNENKERLLVGEVTLIVAKAKHICREISVSDHGIDMEIEFKSDSGEATGRRVYLQLKSGNSYLRKRNRDNSEIFTIKNDRHPGYWMNHQSHVFLVIRSSDGTIRWMEIRDWLRRESRNGKETIKQILFEGEPFDAESLCIWRDRVLAEPARPDIPHEFPPTAEKFIGRTTELQVLTERLQGAQNTAVTGPPGIGKTALAAEVLTTIIGTTPATLAASPFPDGVVFLDLYALHGDCDAAWNTLADKLESVTFLESRLARDRAVEACRGRRMLVIIEGGEEADGTPGRAHISHLLGILLPPRNCWLLLTRTAAQAPHAQTVYLQTVLQPPDDSRLLDELTNHQLPPATRDQALKLLEGHPLAITWAADPLGRGHEASDRLLRDWTADPVLKLSDPAQPERTLKWLFDRSVRGLDATSQNVLAAAALLAQAPFPLAAITAALSPSTNEETARGTLKSLVQRNLLRTTPQSDHWQFAHVLGYRYARLESGSDPAVRARLGNWIHKYLADALATGAGDSGPLSIAAALEHTGALLRADDDQTLWYPLANATLYDIFDRLVAMGRLTMANLALTAVAAWLNKFPAEKAREPDWLRERSALLNRQANVLLAQGDLAAAQAAYAKSLEVMRKLAEADPTNAGWQRDLSVSYEKVGNVLLAQGDLAAAQAAYAKSLEVRRKLAEADPTNAGWQRDLSVSYAKVGDVLRAQGDLAAAQAAYAKSLEVRRKLAEADPTNAGWQRDLSVIYAKVGDVLRAQGDLAAAQAAYAKSLEVRRKLAEADPTNAGWQRDLSWSLTQIAQLSEKQGDRSQALALARESLAIDERLAALDRTNVTWQNDVVITRNLVSRLQR